MYPKSIQTLISHFTKFPGIGPRQAARFAFFVIKEGDQFIQDLALALKEAGEKTAACTQCFRVMEQEHTPQNALCGLCRDPKRDPLSVAVVERESDLHTMEKTGAYHGLYHVLGGVISPFDSYSPKKLHLRALHDRVKALLEKNDSCELILATNATTEGDTTALYIERIVNPLKQKHNGLKLSRLGRGLSLGAELEYADDITLKHALANRK
jgi:recombination protein RecR